MRGRVAFRSGRAERRAWSVCSEGRELGLVRALSVGLEVANLGLNAPPTSDGGFVLYCDNNLGLDARRRLMAG